MSRKYGLTLVIKDEEITRLAHIRDEISDFIHELRRHGYVKKETKVSWTLK